MALGGLRLRLLTLRFDRPAHRHPLVPAISTPQSFGFLLRLGCLQMNILRILLLISSLSDFALCSSDAKRLFEDLFTAYNKLVRPVANNSQLLKVKFKLRLSQLLDVHEKNQIMTTNVWLQHEWFDYKLTWNPIDYANISVLYVPGQLIWLPDLVLYNNADGNYQVTIITKATIHYTGKVQWEPPAIYKSMCQINVQWFPFDEQTCLMKFGSWSYDGFQVDLFHMAEDGDIARYVRDNSYIECVENAIDLSDYYRSTEWDIIAVPGQKKKEKYPCCLTPYTDITYEIHLRRKTLFYTVNLIFPCVGISFLTILVFYLPSDSSEKVTLSISILISLTVFFLLLVEIIPSTSLVIPLIGKYLIFTMVLVTLSICVTVVVISIHFRSPRTHTMSPILKRWFIESSLPSYLWLSPPSLVNTMHADEGPRTDTFLMACIIEQFPFEEKPPWMQQTPAVERRNSRVDNQINSQFLNDSQKLLHQSLSTSNIYRHQNDLARSPSLSSCGQRLPSKILSCERLGDPLEEMRKVVTQIVYIAKHFRYKARSEKVMDDWRFVAMVIDRIFLVLFSLACMVGTSCIILQAPTIYDERLAIDQGDQNVIHAMNGISFCDRR